MELAGSSYLYTLATISITFAGFAVLVTVFRQTIGGRLTNYDIFFVRNVLVRSFIIAGCALLPPLLALAELSPSSIWCISSLIAASLQGLFLLTWPARRRAVSNLPVSKWMMANNVIQLLTTMFLLVNALGIFIQPAAWPFAAGVTMLFLLGFIAYVLGLDVVLQKSQKRTRK
jgi:hypothetical protein